MYVLCCRGDFPRTPGSEIGYDCGGMGGYLFYVLGPTKEKGKLQSHDVPHPISKFWQITCTRGNGEAAVLHRTIPGLGYDPVISP